MKNLDKIVGREAGGVNPGRYRNHFPNPLHCPRSLVTSIPSL